MIELNLGQTIDVPSIVAVCGECGGFLKVTSHANDVETGRPIVDALQIDCENESDDADGIREHKYHQCDWQSEIDRVREWVGCFKPE